MRKKSVKEYSCNFFAIVSFISLMDTGKTIVLNKWIRLIYKHEIQNTNINKATFSYPHYLVFFKHWLIVAHSTDAYPIFCGMLGVSLLPLDGVLVVHRRVTPRH